MSTYIKLELRITKQARRKLLSSQSSQYATKVYIWRSIPSVPLHVGQNCSFGRQCEHTMWPLWHCMIGGNA